MKEGTFLTVESAALDEVFTDMVRVPQAHRLDRDNRAIRNGTVIRIDHHRRKAYAIVRGLQERSDAVIQMDEFMRDRLGVKLGDAIARSAIRPASWLGKIVWHLYASNPTIHVPAWIAMISLGLGVLSIILSLALT